MLHLYINVIGDTESTRGLYSSTVTGEVCGLTHNAKFLVFLNKNVDVVFFSGKSKGKIFVHRYLWKTTELKDSPYNLFHYKYEVIWKCENNDLLVG